MRALLTVIIMLAYFTFGYFVVARFEKFLIDNYRSGEGPK